MQSMHNKRRQRAIDWRPRLRGVKKLASITPFAPSVVSTVSSGFYEALGMKMPSTFLSASITSRHPGSKEG